MRKILMNIESCIVLHNLLVQLNDHLDPEAWGGADRDETSDVDDPGRDESDFQDSDADDLDPDRDVSVETGTDPPGADSGVDRAQPLASDSTPGFRRRQLFRFLMKSA
jgi:hypothetical protein